MSTEQYKLSLHTRLIAQRRSELREANFCSHRPHHRHQPRNQPSELLSRVSVTLVLRDYEAQLEIHIFEFVDLNI